MITQYILVSIFSVVPILPAQYYSNIKQEAEAEEEDERLDSVADGREALRSDEEPQFQDRSMGPVSLNKTSLEF